MAKNLWDNVVSFVSNNAPFSVGTIDNTASIAENTNLLPIESGDSSIGEVIGATANISATNSDNGFQNTTTLPSLNNWYPSSPTFGEGDYMQLSTGDTPFTPDLMDLAGNNTGVFVETYYGDWPASQVAQETSAQSTFSTTAVTATNFNQSTVALEAIDAQETSAQSTFSTKAVTATNFNQSTVALEATADSTVQFSTLNGSFDKTSSASTSAGLKSSTTRRKATKRPKSPLPNGKEKQLCVEEKKNQKKKSKCDTSNLAKSDASVDPCTATASDSASSSSGKNSSMIPRTKSGLSMDILLGADSLALTNSDE